ncbi:mannitol 1-phosphate dehydrogenase [Stemphylium lycopersici]|nr:mannitol 1-phosphate dehydrogenase [Stemphylium lycopersici]
MALGARIGLVVLFSMGFFICLITALRMATLPLSLKTTDITWDAAPTNLWSFIEAATGVICACLISLRKGVAALWPSRWRCGKSKSGAYRQYDDNELNGNELRVLGTRKGTDAPPSYAMGTSKGDNNGNSATYVDISPSESQEHIIKASKAMAQVKTSRPRSSSSRCEDLMTKKDALDLAIVGGGIAGVTLAIGLLTRSPNMHITLYESASAFGEIGAGIGFEPVMVRTMGLIDPRIATAYKRCNQGNTMTEPPRWLTLSVGDERKKGVKMGEEIFYMPARRGPRGGVHRAHFLDELVKLIPKGIAQFKKRLTNVTEAEDGSGDALLHFADGTTTQHHAVLGCDGTKSRTRSIVLGDSEASQAVFSGKYAYLVAFSSRPTWEEPGWVVQASRDDMLNDFKHFSPTVRAIIENVQKPDIWALFDHPHASTYYATKPLVCLVGDAAHASTSHQAGGAGMGIEDVFILSELLSQCSAKSDIKKAFHAFDELRRPRSQKMVKTSREAGMMWDFEGEGIGDDLEALKHNASSMLDWVWDYEILDDLTRAKGIMGEVGV